MFQSKHSDQDRSQLRTTIVILAAIATAVAVTIWLIIEIQREQVAIDEMLRLGEPRIADELRNISGELRWQLPLTVLVLVVLTATAITRVLITYAYANSQRSLRDTKTLAWHTFASIDQGLITTNTEREITSANSQAQRLLNFGGESIGVPLRTICAEGNPMDEITQRVLASGKAEHDQDFVVMREGHLLRLRTHCNRLFNESGQVTGVVLHVRDITERHLIEEQLRRMERYMGMGSVAASLHHEINNPLSALALHLQLLDERLAGNSDVEVEETMQVLKLEIARITGVLNGFREYASILTMNREKTDLASVVNRTIDLIRPQAERQGVGIKLHLPSTDATLRADAALLEQVLLNLVLNALEAMPQGGELRISVRHQLDRVLLTVGDNGLGIPPELRSRIFDPFFTTKPSGSGMGLAICDKIVREHGGQINLESKPEGTHFHITLPRGDV